MYNYFVLLFLHKIKFALFKCSGAPMIRSHISIIGISLSILSLYSCNYGNKSSDVHDSEKSRSYIKFNVNFLDDSTSTARSSRSAREIYSFAAEAVNKYIIDVTVKCEKGIRDDVDFEYTFNIKDTDKKEIPVVENKDCELTFNSFTLDKTFDAVAGKKLTLKYDFKSKIINAAEKAVEYKNDTSKYINGSKKSEGDLNIYIADTPEQVDVAKQSEDIDLNSKDITFSLNHLKAPDDFPLKALKYKIKLGSTDLSYSYAIHNIAGKNKLPDNCKIILEDDLKNPKDLNELDTIYKTSLKVTECTDIDLKKSNNWDTRKDNNYYIILANVDSNSTHHAYRVIKIPKLTD